MHEYKKEYRINSTLIAKILKSLELLTNSGELQDASLKYSNKLL